MSRMYVPKSGIGQNNKGLYVNPRWAGLTQMWGLYHVILTIRLNPGMIRWNGKAIGLPWGQLPG